MAVSQDLANAVATRIQQQYPAFGVITTYELSVSGALPNSTANNTYINATITDPLGGTSVPTQVSQSNWIILWDQNVVSTSDVAADARVKFTKSGDRSYAVTPSLLQNLTANNSRPGITLMVFEPGTSILASQTPVSTTGTAGPYTNTWNVEAIYLSSSYSNASML